MASPSSQNRDSLDSRIPSTCPPETREILLAAWTHNLPVLKPLLDEPGKASIQEPTTRETPLHAAIRSCGQQPPSSSSTTTTDTQQQQHHDDDIGNAKAVVAELLQWGGIWNDVDDKNETPGCVALRLHRMDLYEMCVAAGMRAEMLFNVLGSYEELVSDDEEDMDLDMEEEEKGKGKDRDNTEDVDGIGQQEPADKQDTKVKAIEGEPKDGEAAVVEVTEEMDVEDFEKALNAISAAPADEHVVTSDGYLGSELKYDPKKLVDDAGNGVMMRWETDIMQRSVMALLSDDAPSLVDTSSGTPTAIPSACDKVVDITALPSGKRILNIGFGMGIIDDIFASTNPSKHHIVEAHPAVLSYINTSPDSKFGPDWVDSAETSGANKVWSGRWQDICPRLLADGEIYDAIYFDTFGEDYSQLKLFFTEYIPGLLDEDGKFGFFNGLGADRKICYDVYQQVVEMHLSDTGLDIEWQEINVDMKDMGTEGKGEWEGVVRRYWTLDKYQLPVCSFLG